MPINPFQPLTTPAEIATISSNLNSRVQQQSVISRGTLSPLILFQNFADSVAVTGNTNENNFSTGANPSLPAGFIKANDLIEVLLWVTATNNANVKTLKVKLGATILYQIALASGTGIFLSKFAAIKAATGANNVMVFNDTVSTYSGAGAPTYKTVDFSVANSLTVTGQLATTTDSLVLNGVSIRVHRQL